MKAMRKSMSVKRVLGSLKRKPKDPTSEGSSDVGLDTPEANAARGVRLFCESAGPNGQGDEVLYLPPIVEVAESSPAAAKECAYTIRKSLSRDNYTKPYVQYNAIMLIRILSDNPGPSFTRNIDQKFVHAVKELLRVGRDPSVKQILMETLDTFQRDKAADGNLAALIEMWKTERDKMSDLLGKQPSVPWTPNARTLNAPPLDTQNRTYFSRSHTNNKLPEPQELSTRIEEARNSAQLLRQVVQSTPPSEVIENELVREFADRCQSASRSIQAYMAAENPAPDNNTMETLIETNEHLCKAISQYQRAVLLERKTAGTNIPPKAGTEAPPQTESGFATSPWGAPPEQRGKPLFPPRKQVIPAVPPPGDHAPPVPDDEEPAKHLNDQANSARSSRNARSSLDHLSQPTGTYQDHTGIEPWHPGFKQSHDYAMGNHNSAKQSNPYACDSDSETSPIESANASSAHGKTPVYRY